MSSSPEEDSSLSLSYGICDSLTLKQYDSLKVADRNDDISDEEKLDNNISQQEVDTAQEAFDASDEHNRTASSSPTRTKRGGVRRGQQVSTEVTLSTVMTKTHDGASSVSSLTTASAA